MFSAKSTEFFEDTTMEQEIQRFLKLIAKQGGTDKLGKFLQYLARFLAYVYTNQGDAELAARLTKLMGAISMSRKGPRLGVKLLGEYNNANKLLSKTQSTTVVEDNLKLAKVVCLSYYWYNDNVSFLGKTGFLQGRDLKYIGMQANRGLFFSNCINTILHLKKTGELMTEYASANSENMKRIESELASLRLDLVADLCNLTCAFHFGKFTDYKVNEGLLGLMGMTSAMIYLTKNY